MYDFSIQSMPAYGDLVKRVIAAGMIDPLENTMLSSGLVRVIPKSMGTGTTELVQERTQIEQYASISTAGGQARQKRVQLGWSKQITAHQYDAAITITEQFRLLGNNAQKGLIKEELFDLGKHIPRRIDLDLSRMVGFGFSGGYTDVEDGVFFDTKTPDGQNAFDIAHQLTGSSITYRNMMVGNPGISLASIAQSANYFRYQIFSNLGEQMTMEEDTLVITQNEYQQYTAQMHFLSSAEVSAPNSGVFNPLQRRYKIETLKRIDFDESRKADPRKANMWFLVSKKNTDLSMVEFYAPRMDNPSQGNAGHDILTGNYTFVVRASYGMGWASSKAWIGSTGTGRNDNLFI